MKRCFIPTVCPLLSHNPSNMWSYGWGCRFWPVRKLSFLLGMVRWTISNTVDFSKNEQDRSRYNLLVASMKFDQNNLNNYMYPTSGTDCSVLGLLAYGKERFKPYNSNLQPHSKQTLSWLQIEGNIHTYFPLGNKFGGKPWYRVKDCWVIILPH